ncbi:hypothetical protein FRC18_002884 [Serendipita sp. 400]|nr:hypothetical protein FRC18_002884 [Serendipita sp. 400]
MTYAQLRVPNRLFYTPEPHGLRPTSFSNPHLDECYSWVVEQTTRESILHSYTADRFVTMPLFLLDSIEEDDECVSIPHVFSKSAPAETHTSHFAPSTRRNSPPYPAPAAAPPTSTAPHSPNGRGYGHMSPVMGDQLRPLPTVYEDETESDGQTKAMMTASRRRSGSSTNSTNNIETPDGKDSRRLRRNYAFSDLRELRL